MQDLLKIFSYFDNYPLVAIKREACTLARYALEIRVKKAILDKRIFIKFRFFIK